MTGRKRGMIMSRRIITIGRQYGSNGRRIAKKLSEKLGIHYYDKELIKLASEQNDISYDELVKVDEKRANPWRYPVEDPTQMESRFRFEPMNDVLFYTQAQIITRLADTEDCIIVGRCANDILKSRPTSRSIFIHAPLDYRLQTVMERTSLEEKEALSLIKKVDKQRKFYYNYYTDKKWEEMSQYDLCLDSSAMSENEILNVLTALYESIL